MPAKKANLQEGSFQKSGKSERVIFSSQALQIQENCKISLLGQDAEGSLRERLVREFPQAFERRIVPAGLETPVPSSIKNGTPKRKKTECCQFSDVFLELLRRIAMGGKSVLSA